MTNKKAAKMRKAAWNQALIEGRVVRFQNGITLRSFLNTDTACKAVEEAKAAGLQAEIVSIQSHECPEWDFMRIDATMPEFAACLCFTRET